MKYKFGIILFCALFTVSPQLLAKTVLPDACGDNKIEFQVSRDKNPPAIEAAPAGKAQVVFIETMDKSGIIGGGGTVIRFGLDGTWAGANAGSSYFVVTVDPGLHHVCSDWGKRTGEDSFTAEAGKIYYWEAKVIKHAEQTHMTGMASNGQMVQGSGSKIEKDFEFTQLKEDEGKYRVKVSELSTSKPKK